jgi:hypothetical protein
VTDYRDFCTLDFVNRWINQVVIVVVVVVVVHCTRNWNFWATLTLAFVLVIAIDLCLVGVSRLLRKKS